MILTLSNPKMSQRSIVEQLASGGVVVLESTVYNVINRIGKKRQAKA